MTKFCAETMDAIITLLESVDGVSSYRLHRADGYKPKGKEQDCDAGVVPTEWVDQNGPGFSGDDYSGTITWNLGSHYLVAGFAT